MFYQNHPSETPLKVHHHSLPQKSGIPMFFLGGDCQRIHSWLPSLLGGQVGMAFLKQTGIIITPTQTMHSYGHITHNYHTSVMTPDKLLLVSPNDQLKLPISPHQPSCKVACIRPRLFHLRPSGVTKTKDIKWVKNHGTKVMGSFEKALKSYLVSWLNSKIENSLLWSFMIVILTWLALYIHHEGIVDVAPSGTGVFQWLYSIFYSRVSLQQL